MTIYNFEELKQHIGHKIVCLHYKNVIIDSNTSTDEVTIECETCHEVLYSEFKDIPKTFCIFCKKEMSNEAAFCPGCGFRKLVE